MKYSKKTKCGLLAIIITTLICSICPSHLWAKQSTPQPAEIVLDEIIVNEYSGQYTIRLKLVSTINNDDFLNSKPEQFVSITPNGNYKIATHKDGFAIRGDFKARSTYTIKLRKGFTSSKGAILRKDIKQTITIPEPSPTISFPIKGRYIGRSGNMIIPVQIKNADEIYATIGHVPERNLPIWEEASSWSKKRWEEFVLYGKKVHLDQMGINLYGFDLNSWLPDDRKGLYHIELKACKNSKKKCNSDDLYVIITNIGLITKSAPNKAYVWAVSLETGDPLQDVLIVGFTDRNINAGSCKTNNHGFCSFDYDPQSKGRLSLIVGTLQDDYSYLPLNATELELATFSVNGPDASRITCLSSFIMERDLYRPGEVLNYSVIIRNPSNFTAMILPVTIKIRDPRDRIILSQHKVTDSFGVADFHYTISPDALTGMYFLELYIGDRLIKTQKFLIETFVPQRIQVNLKPFKRIITGSENIAFDLTARYLFGSPASDCKFDSYWEIEPGDNKLFPGYHFGPVSIEGERQELIYWSQSGELNEQGFARLIPSINWSNINKWPSILKLLADVYEPGSGRTVSKSINIPVRLSSGFPGLRVSSITPCQQAIVEGILVNPDGSVVKDNVNLEYSIEKVDYNYSLSYSPEGYRRWEKTVLRTPVFTGGKIVAVNGRFSLSVKIDECWTDLVIKVRNPITNTESEILITGWSQRNRPTNPEHLKIILSHTKVTPGTRIKAVTKLPFKGRVLWTLEESKGKVIKFQWKNEENLKSEIEFTAPDNITTFYVSAYLLQTSGTDFLITRAFGITRFQVIPAGVKAPLSIKAPDIVRPEEGLTFDISGPPGGKVMLAVVDEGILQITDFKSPDLYKSILQPFRLSIKTFEGLGWVYPGKALMSGGGIEEETKSAMIPQFFKTFTLWKTLRLSANGKATISTVLNHYQGSLRIMASVVTASSFASAVAHVKVSPEVAVLPTLPRVIRKGDRINIPIQFTNTTPATIKGKINLSIGKYSANREIILLPNATHIEEFPFEAETSTPIGTVPVRIRFSYNKNKIWQDNYSIEVIPAGIKKNEAILMRIEKRSSNETFNITDFLNDWNKEALKLNITLSYSPILSGLGYIQKLIEYPYGCLEQTSSRLLALVEAIPLTRFMDAKSLDITTVRNLITSGIARLIKMQTYSGGFEFWPGIEYEHTWGSIYATYALIKAHKAGFYIPKSVLSRAVSYLKNLTPSPWRDFVLMEAGQLKYRKPRWAKNIKNKESLILLSLILHREGLTKDALSTLERAYECNTLTAKSKGETFSSPLRTLALETMASVIINPKSEKTGRLLATLIQLMTDSSYNITTQELAWIFSALKESISNGYYEKVPVEATLFINGKAIQASRNRSKNSKTEILTWRIEKTPLSSCRLKLHNPSTAWILISIEGFKKFSSAVRPYVLVSMNLNISGQKDSKVIRLKQRDRFNIRVILTNKTKRTLKHIVVRIPIPAGVEILNPRLYNNTPRKISFEPEYVDIKDDEIRFFGNLPPGARALDFTAQAVFKSETVMPSPYLELLYNPSIFTYGTPRVFVILNEGQK